MAIYKGGRESELGMTEHKASKWPERDSNPGPPDCESDALTTRTRCLPWLQLFVLVEARPEVCVGSVGYQRQWWKFPVIFSLKTYIPQGSHSVKLQIMWAVAKGFLRYKMSRHFKNIDTCLFMR